MNKAVFAIGVSLVGAWLLAGEGPREQPLVEWKFQDTVLPLVPTTPVADTSEAACGTCATLACAPKSEQPAGASRGERRVRIVRRLFRR